LAAPRAQEYFGDQDLGAAVLVAVVVADQALAAGAAVWVFFAEGVVNSYFAFIRHVKFIRWQFAENFFVTLI
jgi:hypothetical protein